MQLRLEQLESHLANGLQPIYLISGDEPLLVQEASDHIRHTATQAGIAEREIFNVDSQFDWNQLMASANTLSLFADRKLVDLRMTTAKPGDAGAKALIAYTESCSDQNILLVTTPKLDKNTQRSRWFKALESNCAWIQTWPVGSQDMPGWLGNRLKQAGLKSDREAVAMLTEQVDGNLLAASQEVEKLRLLHSVGTLISAEIIRDNVADNTRFNVFNLVDACLSGDAARALKILAGLKSEGIEAIQVLWVLSRETRQLYPMRIGLDAGQPIGQVMQQQGVWRNRQSLVKQALTRLHLNTLEQLLRQLGLIDRTVKGVETGNAWQRLERCVLLLAGVRL